MRTKAQLQASLQAISIELQKLITEADDTTVAPEAKRPESPLRNPMKFFEVQDGGSVVFNSATFNMVFPSDGVINVVPLRSGTFDRKVLD